MLNDCKKRGIKGYKGMFEERLLSSLMNQNQCKKVKKILMTQE